MKSKIGIGIYVLFILVFLTATVGAAPSVQEDLPPETHRFGMNIGIGPSDWDPAELFADVMKTFREVTRPNGSAVAKDAKGWPTEDCKFLVWHGLAREAGTYKLRFTGQAASIVADGATVQNKQYNAATNTTTANVVINSGNFLYLTFTGTSGGVKNVKLMMPGHAFTETWNRDFLAAIEPMTVIRLMDFTATNWNQEVNWSDRTLPDAATQQSHPANYGWQGKGFAWEYLIELLNATDKDGWINIPAQANDAYVQNLINLIKNGGNGFAPLETERKLYIEYSNEIWNGIFDQTQFNHDRAVAEVNAGGSPLNFDGETNEWYWGWRREGKRIVEIGDQFRAAFGDSQMMTRFRPVLAWQYGNGQATAETQLDFIQKYYGTNKWGYADPHPVDYYLWCGGGALYYDDIPLAQDTDFQTAVQIDTKYTAAYGIHHCSYEGGITFDGETDTDWYEPWVTQYALDHHQYYEEHGGSMLVYFTLAGTWMEKWGFLETVRDLDTPKYNSIVQLAAQPQAWDNQFGEALPMHLDGADFSLARPSWLSPASGVANVPPLEWRAYHFDANASGPYKVWLEYSSSAAIHLKVYAGSDLVGTIVNNTNGAAATSAKFSFHAYKGLRAIRIENHGDANFSLIKIHVDKGATTANFRSAGTRDGWTLESSETSASGGTLSGSLSTFRVGDASGDRQYRSILHFNTATLPNNATITRVIVRLKRSGVVGTDPFTTHGNLIADVRKGFFGAVGLEIGDFQAAATKENVGRFVPMSGATGWYQLVMNAANYQYINLTGATQFRTRFATDDNDDGGADFLAFFSGDQSAASDRPLLIIEYTTP